jgi:hypothetical protein
MASFAARARRSPLRAVDGDVPRGFDAVVDALRGGGSVTAAVEEIGSRAAREGSSLDDVLIDLEATYLAAHDLPVEPPFDVVRALAVSWADASLRYLHAVSCEDPLTGLASLTHVRTRIIEIYREVARRGVLGSPGGALLVVEIDWRDNHTSHLDRMLRLIDITEILRNVFAGDETIGQLNGSRVVAVVRRDDQMGALVAGLMGLIQPWQDKTGLTARLWIEGLPSTPESAEVLLDELAR